MGAASAAAEQRSIGQLLADLLSKVEREVETSRLANTKFSLRDLQNLLTPEGLASSHAGATASTLTVMSRTDFNDRANWTDLVRSSFIQQVMLRRKQDLRYGLLAVPLMLHALEVWYVARSPDKAVALPFLESVAKCAPALPDQLVTRVPSAALAGELLDADEWYPVLSDFLLDSVRIAVDHLSANPTDVIAANRRFVHLMNVALQIHKAVVRHPQFFVPQTRVVYSTCLTKLLQFARDIPSVMAEVVQASPQNRMRLLQLAEVVIHVAPAVEHHRGVHEASWFIEDALKWMHELEDQQIASALFMQFLSRHEEGGLWSDLPRAIELVAMASASSPINRNIDANYCCGIVLYTVLNLHKFGFPVQGAAALQPFVAAVPKVVFTAFNTPLRDEHEPVDKELAFWEFTCRMTAASVLAFVASMDRPDFWPIYEYKPREMAIFLLSAVAMAERVLGTAAGEQGSSAVHSDNSAARERVRFAQQLGQTALSQYAHAMQRLGIAQLLPDGRIAFTMDTDSNGDDSGNGAATPATSN